MSFKKMIAAALVAAAPAVFGVTTAEAQNAPPTSVGTGTGTKPGGGCNGNGQGCTGGGDTITKNKWVDNRKWIDKRTTNNDNRKWIDKRTTNNDNRDQSDRRVTNNSKKVKNYSSAVAIAVGGDCATAVGAGAFGIAAAFGWQGTNCQDRNDAKTTIGIGFEHNDAKMKAAGIRALRKASDNFDAAVSHTNKTFARCAAAASADPMGSTEEDFNCKANPARAQRVSYEAPRKRRAAAPAPAAAPAAAPASDDIVCFKKSSKVATPAACLR